MAAYEAFASVYDALMDDFDYPAWAEYYLELLARSGKVPKKMCECACGTGSLTVEFAAQGIRVTGVDLSEKMLELAQKKARLNGVQAMFVCQDMCELQLPRPVEAIVCTCDGLNYLTDDERVKAFFERVYASLKPGGVFAFDISSPYKLRNILGNGFFGEERDDVAYLWSNRFDENNQTVTMDLTFFVHEGDELYRRFSENHVQKAHEPGRLEQLLQETGFRDMHIYGDRTFEAPKADEVRIHIAAVRE
ncbi:MAG: class I SAM-dependent methyltransferase [Clostridia bacterium]|nr:class I SAM-dependent methyltransferase [Clostridia bacterium]